MSSARAPDFVRSDTWHRVTTLLDDIVPPSLRHALNLWDDIVEDFEPAPAE